jgi:phosphatidylserine decarboxylase
VVGWAVAGVLAAGAAGYLYLRYVHFFRDPLRRPPGDDAVLVAPCDGTVVYCRPVGPDGLCASKNGQRVPLDELVKAPCPWPGAVPRWIVGVYMSPLDVHFNYAPAPGVVEAVVHTPARVNLPMVDLWEYVNLTYLHRAVDLFGKRHHLVNERNTVFLRGPRGRVAVVEIADKFVNKIDCFLTPGQAVTQGQKIGFIRRGSQVDLVIYDADVTLAVRPGERVVGGETVLARYVT